MDGLEEWALVEFPIGRVDEVRLADLLKEVGAMVCAGLGFADEIVTFRHSVLLAHLDLNESERPLTCHIERGQVGAAIHGQRQVLIQDAIPVLKIEGVATWSG